MVEGDGGCDRAYDLRRMKDILLGYLTHIHTVTRVEKINIGNGYDHTTPKIYGKEKIDLRLFD